MDHRSHSTIKSRIKDHPFRVNINRNQVFNLFKWTLILFNGLMILMILGGLFVYFSEFREKTNFKLTDDSTETPFSDDLETKSPGSSSGPRYAWLVTMFAFALLLAIPCLGFIGAIKEHVCLLVLYGVIFIVEAIVILIFRSFWFLFPALIASAAMGLVILIRSEVDREGDGSSKKKASSKSRISWCLDKV